MVEKVTKMGYGSRADHCFMNWRDAGGALLLQAEANATGYETGCTFNSHNLNAGSLVRPASPSALATGVLSVGTRTLGNAAETLFTWP